MTGTTTIPAYWRDEDDWIVLIEFLPRYDAEDRARGADAIGYMFAYAQMTDTRMLALVGDPEADAYELLFSFSSADNKAEFLRLLNSNDATECEGDEMIVPEQDEIEAAQPIMRVLPRDVMKRVTIVVTMLLGGQDEAIQ